MPNNKMAWHLSHIFEGTIREKPADRFANAESAIEKARTVRGLIEGEFMPLEALARDTCPVCGVGQLRDGLDSQYQSHAGRAHTALIQSDFRDIAFICEYCFNVTLQFQGCVNKRLEERKKLS
jgi:hypothetical protein